MSRKEINLEKLTKQVKRNCDISDSREKPEDVEPYLLEHLYRQEKGVSGKIDRKDFKVWLKSKKTMWKDLKDKDYSKITIGDKEFDISDNQGINKILNPEGLFYRMRDSYNGKPTFLLARISERRKGKYRVLILGKELARDLRTSYYSQCELLDKTIICRYEAERFYIQELSKEMGKKQSKLMDNIEDIIQVHISHEFGHAITRDKGIFPNQLFTDLVERYEGSDIEWFVDSVHEAFAEVIDKGRMDNLIKKRKALLLDIYVHELLSHYKKHPILEYKMKLLFGSPRNLRKIINSKDKWNLLEKRRKTVYKKMLQIVQKLKDSKDKETTNTIKKEFLHKSS